MHLLPPKIAKYVNLVMLKLKLFDEFQVRHHFECPFFAGFYFLALLYVSLINGVVTEVLPHLNSLLTAVDIVVMAAIIV